jgi:hypothetical protein
MVDSLKLQIYYKSFTFFFSFPTNSKQPNADVRLVSEKTEEKENELKNLKISYHKKLTSKPISCIELSLAQLQSLFLQVPNQQREKLEMLRIQYFPNFLSNQAKTLIIVSKFSKQNNKFKREI